MGTRVSESAFSVSVGDMKMNVDKATLSIEDDTDVAKDRGVPNGHVDGGVGASGDLELDAAAMAILTESAKSAGSWQGIPALDLMFYAKGTVEEEKVEAFGCKLKVQDLVNYDPSSNKKAVTKVGFVVTSPDFVHINGVPYLDPARIEGIVPSDG